MVTTDFNFGFYFLKYFLKDNLRLTKLFYLTENLRFE